MLTKHLPAHTRALLAAEGSPTFQTMTRARFSSGVGTAQVYIHLDPACGAPEHLPVSADQIEARPWHLCSCAQTAPVMTEMWHATVENGEALTLLADTAAQVPTLLERPTLPDLDQVTSLLGPALLTFGDLRVSRGVLGGRWLAQEMDWVRTQHARWRPLVDTWRARLRTAHEDLYRTPAGEERYIFFPDAVATLLRGRGATPVMRALVACDWVASTPQSTWVVARVPVGYFTGYYGQRALQQHVIDLGPAVAQNQEADHLRVFTTLYQHGGQLTPEEAWETASTITEPALI